MSSGKDQQVEFVQIFVRLLGEGTRVYRPTNCVSLGGGRYRLLPSKDYDPSDEEWEFSPGTVVNGRTMQLSDGVKLVAWRSEREDASELDQTSLFRPMTQLERRIVDRLLSVSFQGVEDLRCQLACCLVRQIDDDGSLAFQVDSTLKAPVQRRIPVEAETVDRDGVCAHILLHVVDGKADELEIYRDDPSTVAGPVDLDKMELIVLGP